MIHLSSCWQLYDFPGLCARSHSTHFTCIFVYLCDFKMYGKLAHVNLTYDDVFLGRAINRFQCYAVLFALNVKALQRLRLCAIQVVVNNEDTYLVVRY